MTDTILAAFADLASTPPAYGIAAFLVLFWLCSAVKDKNTRIWGQHVAIIAMVGCVLWWAASQTATEVYNCIGAL